MSNQIMAMRLLDYRAYTLRSISFLERAIKKEYMGLDDLLKSGELSISAKVCEAHENIEVLQGLLDEARKLVET